MKTIKKSSESLANGYKNIFIKKNEKKLLKNTNNNPSISDLMN